MSFNFTNPKYFLFIDFFNKVNVEQLKRLLILNQNFLTRGPWIPTGPIDGFQKVRKDQIEINIYIRYTARPCPNRRFPSERNKRKWILKLDERKRT